MQKRDFSNGLLVRTRAIHAGIEYEEREDCAASFVQKMLQQTQNAEALRALCQTSPAYIRVCARNFIRNYCRSEARRKQRMCTWTYAAETTSRAREATSARTALEVHLCQQELSSRLGSALNELPPLQKLYMVRHYVYHEPILHIAQSLGKSPHSVEQALFRARRRLRTSLESAGLSQSELDSYLCFFAPPPICLPARIGLRHKRLKNSLKSQNLRGKNFPCPFCVDLEINLRSEIQSRLRELMQASGIMVGKKI